MSETDAESYWDTLGSRPMTDQDHVDAAVMLMVAVMRSASTDKIRPLDWWARARSAMEVAASQAQSFSHFVSRMAQKLQIEAYRLESAKEIYSLGQLLKDADAFKAFSHICRRDALYITAFAQIENTKRREERKNA